MQVFPYDKKLNGYSYSELVEGAGPMKPGNLLHSAALVPNLTQGDRPWMIRVKGAYDDFSFPH